MAQEEQLTDREIVGSPDAQPVREESRESIAGRPFALSSSYGPSSEIVKTMKKAAEKEGGVPLYIYELMQGQVDYGRNSNPPPRITIERKSGKREEFNGVEIEQIEEDPITAIEFANGGKGMTPEDTVIDRHDSGGASTLGMHGHGTTVSLCYLTQMGMPVKMSSHFRGNSWSGGTSLQSTESGVAKILHLDGKWGEKNEGGEANRTVFRIENPTSKFVNDLARAGQYFIYANPKYPGAMLVSKKEGAENKIPNAVAIESGQVQCVEGIVPDAYDKKGECNTVFVDGLAMKDSGWRRSIFPWAVQGFGSENVSYYHRVKRKYDSSGIEGSPARVVAESFRQLENKELLKRALKKAIETPEQEYWEFSIEDELGSKYPLSANVAAMVKQIWEEDYENVAVDHSDERIKWYGSVKKGAKAKRVSKGVFSFLKAAGVPTVEGQSGLKDARRLDGLSRMSMPSVFESDGFNRFMEMLGKEGAEVDIVTLSGKRYIRIRLPQIIKSYGQLDGKDEDRGGVLLRIAAALTHLRSLDLRAFSLEPACHNEMNIETVAHNDKSVDTTITFLVKDRKSDPEFSTWENGHTYMLIPGEHLEPPSEALLERYKKMLKEYMAKRGKFKGFQPRRDVDGEGQDSLPKTILRSGVGQIPINERGVGGRRSKEPENSENILPNGYYAQAVGTTFMFDSQRCLANWQSAENWAAEDVSKTAPKKFGSKVVENNFNGEMRLNVLTGQKITALVADGNSDLELFREVRTGHYLLRGRAGKLAYYTAPSDDDFYELFPPIPDEQEDVLDMDLLLPEWKDFIASVHANPALTVSAKVQLVQQAWAKKFTYSDDDGLDDQSVGKSREEIAAKIVNTSRGICNIGASGFIFLLRAVGVSARAVVGHLRQGEGQGGSHMWVQYWNNKRWIALEAEIGVSFAPSVKRDQKSEVTSLQAALEALNGTRPDDQPSFVPGKKLVRTLVGAVLAGVVTLGAVSAKSHYDWQKEEAYSNVFSADSTSNPYSPVLAGRASIHEAIKEHCSCLVAPQKDPLCAQNLPKKSKRK